MSRRSNTGWLRPGFREYHQSGKPLDLSQPTNAGLKFEWQCGGPAGKSTLAEKIRPKECRGGAAK
jgi:hypothetical protein